MSDLTIQYFWECPDITSFGTFIKGSTTYWASFSNGENGGVWNCDCKGFKYRGTCKHIKEAASKKCDWMEFLEGPPIIVEGNTVCPKCGKTAVSRAWGV